MPRFLEVIGKEEVARVEALDGDLAEPERVIRRDQDGLVLTIDPGKLEKNEDGKAEAIRTLEDVLSQLRT